MVDEWTAPDSPDCLHIQGVNAEKWTSGQPLGVGQAVGRVQQRHGRGAGAVHSSTFRLNLSAFCGIRGVVSVTKTAQVELKSGRV
jgi:hypothetical protein